MSYELPEAKEKIDLVFVREVVGHFHFAEGRYIRFPHSTNECNKLLFIKYHYQHPENKLPFQKGSFYLTSSIKDDLSPPDYCHSTVYDPCSFYSFTLIVNNDDIYHSRVKYFETIKILAESDCIESHVNKNVLNHDCCICHCSVDSKTTEQLFCGHVYCSLCIKTVQRASGNDFTCSICKVDSI